MSPAPVLYCLRNEMDPNWPILWTYWPNTDRQEAVIVPFYMSVIAGTVAPRAGAAQHAPTRTRVAWAPKGEIEHPEWVVAGRKLGAIERGSQWWIGDWLLYGAAKWGEKYVEAAKIIGYDVRSLRNMASLASQFDLSRRRDNLTWCHHAAVASLELDDQDHWLDRATALRLSVSDLRIELRSARRGCMQVPNSDDDPPAGLTEVSEIVCPNCGHSVPLTTSPEEGQRKGSLLPAAA